MPSFPSSHRRPTHRVLNVPACSLLLFLIATSFCAPLAAQDDAKAAKTADAKTATQVLAESRKNLNEFTSVSAKMREEVVLGTKKFNASGSYLQAQGNRVRVELFVDPTSSLLEEAKAKAKKDDDKDKTTEAKPKERRSILQVSDGKNVYTRVTAAGVSRVEYRDFGKITKDLGSSDTWSPDRLVADMGLGGLPAILSNMEKRMVFSGVKKESIQGKQFLVIQGRWNDQQLQLFNPNVDSSDPILQPELPEYVRVYFEEENSLFPRRILYLKRHPNPKQRLARPMVTLDFTDVKINDTVDPKSFEYKSDGTEVDITQQVIDRLKPQSASGTPVNGPLRSKLESDAASRAPKKK